MVRKFESLGKYRMENIYESAEGRDNRLTFDKS